MTPTLYSTNTGVNVTASVSGNGLSGLGANVNPRLFCQVRLEVSKAPDWHRGNDIQAWAFGVLSGYMRMGNEQVADIKSYSVNSWLWGELRTEEEKERNRQIRTEIFLNIEVPLDAKRIEWIEQQRNGRSFEAVFHIALQVQIFGRNFHTPSFSSGLVDALCIEGDIPIVVPDTKWREGVLPSLGYGKIMVIELPAIGPDACSALDHSLKAFENAKRQFESGFYDETAASCRVALEQFFESHTDESGKKIPRLKKSWETTLGEATYQWLDTALSTIKTATNRPHHSPGNHFNRLGAQMILMVTTALVSYAAQYYSGQNEKPPSSGGVAPR